MFQLDWLILSVLYQSFEVERPKGHCSEVVVHLYIPLYPVLVALRSLLGEIRILALFLSCCLVWYQMPFEPTPICRKSIFPILGVLGGILHFYTNFIPYKA